MSARWSLLLSLSAISAVGLGAKWLYASTAGARSEYVHAGSVTRKVVAAGVVVPANGVAHVRPRVDGRVLRVFVHEGDPVQPGQVLAELDTDLLSAEARRLEAERNAFGETARSTGAGSPLPAVQAADAEIAAARAEMDLDRDRSARQKDLVERGSSTDAALAQARYIEDQARAKVSALEARRRLVATGAHPGVIRAAQQRVLAAQAALDAALVQVGWARLVSPVAGVVLAARAEEGDTVVTGGAGSGPPLFEIADPSEEDVRVEIDEVDAPLVAAGLPVVLHAVGAKEKMGTGVIARLGEQIEKRTSGAEGRERDGGMVRVAWVEPTWVDAAHRPEIGQKLEADVELPAVQVPAVVPRAAVAVRDGRATVEVPWGPVWREKAVELGAADDLAVEVRGLPSGTRVRVP
jgi:HlyD family secretion protein